MFRCGDITAQFYFFRPNVLEQYATGAPVARLVLQTCLV